MKTIRAATAIGAVMAVGAVFAGLGSPAYPLIALSTLGGMILGVGVAVTVIDDLGRGGEADE